MNYQRRQPGRANQNRCSSLLSINIANRIHSATAPSCAHNNSSFHLQSTEGRIPNDCQKAEHCSFVEMDSLSYTRYVIVVVFMSNSIVSDDIGVSNTSSDQWKLAISVSTRTMSDESTIVPTVGKRSEHKREYIGTNSVSDSDTTDNAPTLDPGYRGDNATHLCMNTPSDPMSPSKVSLAVDVINRLQLAITSVGFFANAATYVTLTFNSERLSPLVLLLIKHQALIDTVVCGMGSLKLKK